MDGNRLLRAILIRTVRALPLVLSVFVTTVLPGHAQETLPSAVVAVIDYQRVFRDTAAARSIRTQIEQRRTAYQNNLEAEERRLRAVEKELRADQESDDVPAEEFAARRRAFEQDYAAVQRQVQEQLRQLDRLRAQAEDQISRALIDIVGELQESRGFNLVIPHSDVLFFAPQLDLTEDVLSALNRSLPEVRLSALSNN